MKRIALITAALMMSGSIAAHAASLPSPVENISPALTEQDIATGLEALGYSDVYDVEGAGRFYTARAHYNGVWYPLQIDASTGEVTSSRNVDYKYISVVGGSDKDRLVTELERLGYSHVKLGAEQGSFTEAEAHRYGQVTYLTVDTRTGQVIDHEQGYAWFVPVSDDMTEEEAKAHLQTLGYENARDMENTGSMYTYTATRAGKDVTVYVDAESGEVHQLGERDPG